MKTSTILTTDIQEKIDHLAEAIAEEIIHEIPLNSLIPSKQRYDLIKIEVSDMYTQFFQTLQAGLMELNKGLSEINSDSRLINIEMNQLWDAFNKIDELKNSGHYPKDYCHLSSDDIKTFNKIAALLYETKEYPRAGAVYTLLTYLDPAQPAFWLGLGNSQYFNKNYEAALKSYERVAAINHSDVQSYFYSAHCHHLLLNTELALQKVYKAMEIIDGDPEQKKWKKSAEELIAFLSKPPKKK